MNMESIKREGKPITENWLFWTFLEAGSRTGSKLFQKIIGRLSANFVQTFYATLFVGLTQVIFGALAVKIRRKKFIDDWKNILGACSFGFLATINTVVPFSIFLLGGDIGINAFITTLAIVPGALIDRTFFKYKLSVINWLGIFVAIFAGYSILGWPNLKEFLALPLWVWLSFISALLVAINQGISQKIKQMDPMLKNFWGGGVTFILALVGLLCFRSLNLLTTFSPSIMKLALASSIAGLFVIGIWSFNLLGFKKGATIAIKNIVMNGFFLISSMGLGIIIFNEPFTLFKVISIPLYLIAYILLNRKTNYGHALKILTK